MDHKLTLAQIRARSTQQSFSRGQSYFTNRAIFDGVQRGHQIEGFCEASSQPEPYHIRVTLAEGEIAEASCTCEYDWSTKQRGWEIRKGAEKEQMDRIERGKEKYSARVDRCKQKNRGAYQTSDTG